MLKYYIFLLFTINCFASELDSKNHPLRRVFSEKSLEVYLLLQKELDQYCIDHAKEEHELFFHEKLEALGLQYPTNQDSVMRKAEAFALIAQEMRKRV